MPEYQSRTTPGPVLLLVGTWGSTVTYRPGFVVNHAGTAYVCLKTQKNVTPGTDASVWTGISSGTPGPAGDSNFPPHSTLDSPDPAVAGVGGTYYDTDLSLPLWSDGALWHYSNGNPRGE